VEHENVSATLTLAVPVTRVFAVLADPTTHSAIDGTGWVFVRERGIRFPPFGPDHLVDSLHHLAELATPKSRV